MPVMKRLAPVFLALLWSCPSPSFGEEGPGALVPDTWVATRTASVVVYHVPEAPIPTRTLRELEIAVGRLARRLGLSDEKVRSLRSRPIQYLYAQDASALSWFGLEDVDGVAQVADRKILSTRLPHEHELTHVLAYLAIEPAPTGNQPWLQEGLASYLGGHLGEAPWAVLAAGDHVLARDPGSVARLFRADSFRHSALGTEDRYAVSARFVQYLDETRGGMRPLLELLRLLAGDEAEVRLRPADVIETQLEGVYSTGFAELYEDFLAWSGAQPVAGIVPVPRPDREPDFVVEDRDHVVEWWRGPEGWVISVTPGSGRMDLALSWGATIREPGVWTAPSRRSGFELRLDENGGRLLDHGQPRVLLRWYADRGFAGARTWFLPASATPGVEGPGQGDVVLWSQPRFEVD